jgi:hypothetical protein
VWVLAARALAGDAVARTVVDLGGFDFDQVRDVTDEQLLPGAVKYGGIRGLASLATGSGVTIFGAPPAPVAPWIALPAGVRVEQTPASVDQLVAAVLAR